MDKFRGRTIVMALGDVVKRIHNDTHVDWDIVMGLTIPGLRELEAHGTSYEISALRLTYLSDHSCDFYRITWPELQTKIFDESATYEPLTRWTELYE